MNILEAIGKVDHVFGIKVIAYKNTRTVVVSSQIHGRPHKKSVSIIDKKEILREIVRQYLLQYTIQDAIEFVEYVANFGDIIDIIENKITFKNDEDEELHLENGGAFLISGLSLIKFNILMEVMGGKNSFFNEDFKIGFLVLVDCLKAMSKKIIATGKLVTYFNPRSHVTFEDNTVYYFAFDKNGNVVLT